MAALQNLPFFPSEKRDALPELYRAENLRSLADLLVCRWGAEEASRRAVTLSKTNKVASGVFLEMFADYLMEQGTCAFTSAPGSEESLGTPSTLA
jgi:hypothetical protein